MSGAMLAFGVKCFLTKTVVVISTLKRWILPFTERVERRRVNVDETGDCCRLQRKDKNIVFSHVHLYDDRVLLPGRPIFRKIRRTFRKNLYCSEEIIVLSISIKSLVFYRFKFSSLFSVLRSFFRFSRLHPLPQLSNVLFSRWPLICRLSDS